jgi:GGDEF domain-containing protein
LATNPYIMPTGRPLFVRLSQGFATHPGDANSLEELLETSDASLYRSKQSGGNTFATVSADRAPSSYQRAQPHQVMQA